MSTSGGIDNDTCQVPNPVDEKRNVVRSRAVDFPRHVHPHQGLKRRPPFENRFGRRVSSWRRGFRLGRRGFRLGRRGFRPGDVGFVLGDVGLWMMTRHLFKRLVVAFRTRRRVRLCPLDVVYLVGRSSK